MQITFRVEQSRFVLVRSEERKGKKCRRKKGRKDNEEYNLKEKRESMRKGRKQKVINYRTTQTPNKKRNYSFPNRMFKGIRS